jgi:hypothetical protein
MNLYELFVPQFKKMLGNLEGWLELRARIQDVLAYLDGYRPHDFEGADTKVIAPPSLRGKSVVVTDYVLEMQLPNFYFHVCTAYAILRHNGVELGKTDFLGSLSLRDG